MYLIIWLKNLQHTLRVVINKTIVQHYNFEDLKIGIFV
jgi:hypothetical protein